MFYTLTKRLLFFAVFLTSLTTASAQAGRFGVGLDACYANSSPGASIKAQYNILNFLRVELSGSTYFDKPSRLKLNEVPFISGGLGLHATFLRLQHRRLHCYWIAGASYTHMRYFKRYRKYKLDDRYNYFGLGKNKFGGSTGLGLLYRISRPINLTLEGTYDSVLKTNIKIGFVYNFYLN